MQTILNNTYQIVGEIGHGGGGTVYKAMHLRLNKYVVVKRIHGSVQAKRNEVDILKNLKNPYLPQVYDFVVVDGEVYTVMEFIDGKSFKQLLDQGVIFSQDQAAMYGGQLLEALSYLHSQRIPIIHGDVKPGNVMLTPENKICLIDFNISGYLTGGRAVTVGYSRGYAAPEQIMAVLSLSRRGPSVAPGSAAALGEELTVRSGSGESSTYGGGSSFAGGYRAQTGRERTGSTGSSGGSVLIDNTQNVVSTRSDLYSVGAFLYHLVTGVRPAEAYQNLRPLSQNAAFSDSFAHVVDKAMSYSPADRYASAQEMRKELVNFRRYDSRYIQKQKRKRIAIAVVTLCACVGIILLFAGIHEVRQHRRQVYDGNIARLEEYIEEGDEESFETVYEACISQAPDRIEAYVRKAQLLYQQGRYADCINYVSQTAMTVISDDSDPSELGRLYYILGNAYLDSGENDAAAQSLERALRYTADNSEYYRDYAIALAREGSTGQAQTVLAQAEDMGLLDDQIALVEGEIEEADADYDKAIESFRYVTENSADSTILARAYQGIGESYESKNPSEEERQEEVRLLTQALTALPADRTPGILEQLAQAYIYLYDSTGQNTYADSAVEALEKILSGGWGSFVTYSNLILLRQEEGMLEEAKTYAEEMLRIYPDRYETYKRLAFLDIETQQGREESARDYSAFKEHYQKAVSLSSDQLDQNDSDPEMWILEDAYTQLVQGGWLE